MRLSYRMAAVAQSHLIWQSPKGGVSNYCIQFNRISARLCSASP